jgi:hypothetical protein
VPQSSHAKIGVAAGVLAIVLMSACGGDEGGRGEEGAIREVMKGYYLAVLQGDRATACSYLTKAVKEASGDGCLVPNDSPGPLDSLSDAEKDAYLDANEELFEKRKVTVDGDTARSGSWILRKENGEWRIEGDFADGAPQPPFDPPG